MRALFVAVCLLCWPICVWADGPGDNIPEKVRRIPKLGVEVPAEDRAVLEAGLKELAAQGFATQVDPQQKLPPHWADVAVYYKALHDALKYQEFFDVKEIAVAKDLLKEAKERAAAFKNGEAPWLKKAGPVACGYVSKIDGSVQPYGLVIPAGYDAASGNAYRLDFWFHGRGENLSELNFINDRRKNPGQFTPPNTFVLHAYGRYCNANKFAGEIDAFEALEAVKKTFKIDENRINVRGFSMGGAACWQFAVHYADRWCSASPGAGFSETPDFLKVFQKEDLKPTWWEKKLWHWYDCTDWAANLEHLPTVAYSGEKDIQKQAADMMVAAFKKEGLPELKHIIGPNTGHSYEAKAKEEINRLIDGFNEKGRDPRPKRIHLVTYHLRYNKMHWVQVTGLERQWERAEVVGELSDKEDVVTLTTKNVSELSLSYPAHPRAMNVDRIEVRIDGQKLVQGLNAAAKPFEIKLHREAGAWKLGERKVSGLVKSPGVQGPIDDAFLDSFIFVLPSGKPQHEKIGQWCDEELDRAIEHWRRHFRGEVRVKKDTDITQQDSESANLILWGDPSSNAVLKQVAGKLPIAWTAETITAGEKKYDAKQHALIAIYPNPLNPHRYIVLNSSFTYRDYAYLNNARQVPMLPDWAIVDVTTPPNAVWPGKIADADFFGERWEFQRTPEHDKGTK